MISLRNRFEVTGTSFGPTVRVCEPGLVDNVHKLKCAYGILGRIRSQHRRRDARHASQLTRIVLQVDLPDLGGAADVDRARCAGDPAAGRALQMVGIDVQPYRAVALGA